MVSAVIIVLLAAIALGFAFVPGLGLLAILPAVLAIALAVWVVAGVAGGRTPGEAVRRTRRPRLLGPGGPDDPEARR